MKLRGNNNNHQIKSFKEHSHAKIIESSEPFKRFKETSDTRITQFWGLRELVRWYRRGKRKLDRALRIEILYNKVLNLDIYFRNMLKLHLTYLPNIQQNHLKVVRVGTSSSEYATSEPDFAQIEDVCQHKECHLFRCKFEKSNLLKLEREDIDHPLEDQEDTIEHEETKFYEQELVSDGKYDES